MFGRVGGAIFALVLLFWIGTPAIENGVHDWRTDEQTQAEIVVTGVGETTADVILDYDLFGNNETEIISITSSITETPVATDYTSITNTLEVSALTADETRTLTIIYNTPVDDLVMDALGPFLTILILVGLTGLILLAAWGSGKFGRSHRR